MFLPHRIARAPLAAATFIGLLAAPASAQSISAAQQHVCAVGARGDLHCWGARVWTHGADVPLDSVGAVAQPPGVAIKQFETGWLHDCALTADGRVFCAGNNSSGELGRAIYEPCPSIGCGLPAPVETNERFASITIGQAHTCALTAAGEAYCWGMNDAGQTGVGSRAQRVDRPAPVVGGYRFKSIAAGDRHTCGLTLKGVVLCWGANNWGQLGSNAARRACQLTADCMAIPAPVDEQHAYVSLAGGWGKMCGITAPPEGALYCWGRYYTQIVGETPVKPMRVGATRPFLSVSLGYGFACGIVRGGSAYCWRETPLATIGREPVTWGCPNGADICLDETPVGDKMRFVAVASGEEHACGIATTGGVYCWGVRDISRLGGRTPTPECALGKRDESGACAMVPLRVGGELDLLKKKR
jgi:alpha-tubulin suppressor-like RCC1 family protein